MNQFPKMLRNVLINLLSHHGPVEFSYSGLVMCIHLLALIVHRTQIVIRILEFAF